MNPVRELARGRTYRRIVHVLLGAVVLLPYLALAYLFVLSVQSGMSTAALVPLVAVAVGVGASVAVVPGVRTLEIAAARALLGVRVDDPAPDSERDWSGRRRGALWLLVCMLVGAVAALAVLLAVPVTVSLLIAPWLALPPLPTGPTAWWTVPLGVLLTIVLLAALAAAGAGLARLAPRLLGPTPAERLAAALNAERRRAATLAERTRLARELHDSVGHALTVTTLQAGAAAEVLDTDPAFARRALDAIAETGRTALDELDHVLGLLRDDAVAGTEPTRDLAALDVLVTGARSAGVEVDLRCSGDVAALPAPVSREAYRLLQEALTNALRHAGPVPVTVRVDAAPDGLHLTVDNPLSGRTERPSTRRGGRGVRGMAERADLLGGTLTAGPADGVWRLAATLPGIAR